jgi:hypothetical protein
MRQLALRSACAIGAILAGLLAPKSLPAQSAADTALLSVPADSLTTCHFESGFAAPSAPPGSRAYTFEAGRPVNVLRDATGRVFFPGMPPREISIVFDSGGNPLMVADMADITQWRQSAVVAYFPMDRPAFGFHQVAEADSAAVMERVKREGLQALQAASREATHLGPQEPLDSAALRRARVLAVHFWPRRCP